MPRFLTNAPDAYDYGYTTEVGRTEHIAYEGCKPLPVRIVEIPESHADYQTARYQSGLYVAIAYEPTPEQRIAGLEAAVSKMADVIRQGFTLLKSVNEAQDRELEELRERLQTEIDDRRRICSRLHDEIRNTSGQLSDMRGE